MKQQVPLKNCALEMRRLKGEEHSPALKLSVSPLHERNVCETVCVRVRLIWNEAKWERGRENQRFRHKGYTNTVRSRQHRGALEHTVFHM